MSNGNTKRTPRRDRMPERTWEWPEDSVRPSLSGSELIMCHFHGWHGIVLTVGEKKGGHKKISTQEARGDKIHWQSVDLNVKNYIVLNNMKAKKEIGII